MEALANTLFLGYIWVAFKVGRDFVFLLTHSGDDLRLHAELVGEATGEIVDSTFSIAGHVGDPPDVIEHVAGGEKQDEDQTDAGPEIAVLDDGQDVGICDGDEGEETEQDGHGRADAAPVDRSTDARVVSRGQLAQDPAVHALGGLGA